MAQIHLLDESIAQKIAAGEVVERPASVVKELVENAIDAGSTFTTVEIAEGGVERIRVTDNGCGIPAGEVELAFLRHATSKIQDLQDLYNITQMGFRGEALYSIAAVSKLELTTKPAAQASGVRLVMQGGRRASMSEYGCPDGTTIVVSDLFFNTPARLKFLNKAGVEAGYVSSIVVRHILANPGVSIKFITNDKVIYHSAGDGSLKNAIYTIYGKETVQGLLPVELADGGITVSGYLFAPSEATGNRSRQMLIVNGRPVNNFAVSSIVERAYSGMTDAKRFPGYVLGISLAPADVDVNVHPNKLQVRFTDEYKVKQAVEVAVSKSVEKLKGQPLLWAFPAREDEKKTGEAEQADTVENTQGVQNTRGMPSEPVESIGETVDRLRESVRMTLGAAGLPGIPAQQPSLMQRPSIPNIAAGMPVEQLEQATMAEKAAVRTIGQVFETYALLEYEDKLLIVDQHAAHERLYYERFLERQKKAEPCSQKLLIPQVVNVSYEVKAVLDANIALLENLGFELEEYGRLSWQVRAVPFILGQPQAQDVIFEVVDILSDDRAVRSEELKREKLMSMACKKAVKAGDRLSASELAELVKIISAEDMPLTCPHGRPFVIILDRKSMEKQFRRTK
jgi:DNA mismatch repair protein MutL